MRLEDAIIAALVLAAALTLLYRSLFRRRGACHGCSSGACGPRERAAAPLVRLGAKAQAGDEQGISPPACPGS